jgi:hypothetical protein
MTDNELGVYLANLAATAASNTEAITRQAESIRELRTTMTEGFESQARSIESLRESVSYNTETMATALELAAISQRTAAAAQESAAAAQVTAAAAMELSANTSRNIDKLTLDIARLEQMMGIVIKDGQADRGRITRLEGQN